MQTKINFQMHWTNLVRTFKKKAEFQISCSKILRKIDFLGGLLEISRFRNALFPNLIKEAVEIFE